MQVSSRVAEGFLGVRFKVGGGGGGGGKITPV